MRLFLLKLYLHSRLGGHRCTRCMLRAWAREGLQDGAHSALITKIPENSDSHVGIAVVGSLGAIDDEQLFQRELEGGCQRLYLIPAASQASSGSLKLEVSTASGCRDVEMQQVLSL